MQHRLTIGLPTRDRYNYLSLILWSLINQTYQDWRLEIIDNTPEDKRIDIRTNPAILQLLQLIDLTEQGRWAVTFGDKNGGPQHAHQMVLNKSQSEFTFRVDDDCVMDRYCLENLVNEISKSDKIYAVAPLVFQSPLFDRTPNIFIGTHCNEIQPNGDIIGENAQWLNHNDSTPKTADHLYSSYIYRTDRAKEIGGYNLNLSKVGHREETDFSHRLKRAGGELLVLPTAKMYHLRAGSGGIRSETDTRMYQDDDMKWHARYQKWQNKGKHQVFVGIEGGMGDHIAADVMLRGVRKKYPDSEIIVGAFYPFMVEGHPCIDRIAGSNLDESVADLVLHQFPYKWAIESNYDGHLVDMICQMYKVENDGLGLTFDWNKQYKEAKIEEPQNPFVIIAPWAMHGVLGTGHPKNWLGGRWEKVVKYLKEKGIDTIQVGKEDTINSVTTHNKNSNIGQTAKLLSHPLCKGFISLDTLLQHLAMAMKKKGIVLWTASNPKYFGYDFHYNLGGKCPDNYARCKSPNSPWVSYGKCLTRVCANLITVENVIEKIEEMLK